MTDFAMRDKQRPTGGDWQRPSMKLSMIVPTFNEEQTIERVIARVLATKFPAELELILVDDHSTDRTMAIERRLCERARGVSVKVIRSRTRRGKSACIRRGLKHATGDIVIVQDGDLEYDPRDIPKLLGPILDGHAQVSLGSRFLGRWWPRGMGWLSFLANRFLTWLTNRLYGLRLTDVETCYKAIRRDQLRQLRFRGHRFEFDLELVAQLARRGARLAERPISYSGRTRREGKKVRARDFVLAVWTLLRER